MSDHFHVLQLYSPHTVLPPDNKLPLYESENNTHQQKTWGKNKLMLSYITDTHMDFVVSVKRTLPLIIVLELIVSEELRKCTRQTPTHTYVVTRTVW